MLFLNQDIELSLDLRRQHEYLDACNYEDPYFTFNEGSSLMHVVSACGNIQPQRIAPFSDEMCHGAFNMQPGPIPGFDANRLDLAHHLHTYNQHSGETSSTSLELNPGGKKRASTSSASQKSSEGSPAMKRAKSTSVHTSFRPH